MGYWNEKRIYESERLSSAKLPTLRERERNLVFQEELSKLNNISSGLLLCLGFVVLVISAGLLVVTSFGFIGIIIGIFMLYSGGKTCGENKVIAWKRAVKRIGYVNEKKRGRE